VTLLASGEQCAGADSDRCSWAMAAHWETPEALAVPEPRHTVVQTLAPWVG